MFRFRTAFFAATVVAATMAAFTPALATDAPNGMKTTELEILTSSSELPDNGWKVEGNGAPVFMTYLPTGQVFSCPLGTSMYLWITLKGQKPILNGKCFF